MSTQDSSAEPKPDLQLEIAHLLLIDVVGYSRLIVNEQIELIRELNRVVRGTQAFQTAEKSGKLIRLPTGDGMALLFFRSPEEPARCALEISQALKVHPEIQLRMGIHSGPVNEVTDVNDRSNIAGAGINVAQRVMDCGDAGHILISKHVADDLAQYRHWQPYLHDLGECEVKHGLRLHIVNLYKDDLGNPASPEKLRRGRRWKQTTSGTARPVGASRWPRWALISALVLSVVALAISFSIFLRRGSSNVTRSPLEGSVVASIPAKSIAVMPFENLSDDQKNSFFADGVQDEILTDLGRIADLKVISRTSVMQYKTGANRNLRDIAKALGVAHVVEGSVQRTGNRVRVIAQLIDARTDTHLWAERYDRDLADVFAIQSEIAKTIADQLQAKISPNEKAAIEKPPTANVAAYDLYVRAKALINGVALNTNGAEDLLEAVHLLEQAIARDPAFSAAHYQLARTHDQIYFLGIDHTAARLALAQAAVEETLRLWPKTGEAHLASAQHLYYGYRDYDRARQELESAKRALPNDPVPIVLAAYIDRRQGRWDESTHELERALELDPRNFFILQQIALSFASLRRYADMATALDRALAIAPSDLGTRVQRAAIDLDWQANPRPLHAIIQSVITEDPAAARHIADHWLVLALCERDNDAAERALAALAADGWRNEGLRFPRAWCEGLVAMMRGDNSSARSAFERARADVEETMRNQPNYAEGLCVLGIIDAALGRKDQAITEGRRAVELLPVTKDSINGALLIQYLAATYALAGEKDLALEEIATAVRTPGDLSYGQLRLHPFWDSLRGDPRFEKIVASLAPDAKKP